MGLTVLKSGANTAVFLLETLGRIHFLAFSSFQSCLHSWSVAPSYTCKAIITSSSNLTDLWLCSHHHISSPIRAPWSHALCWDLLFAQLQTYMHKQLEMSHPRIYSHQQLKDFTSWDTYPQTSPSWDHCIWPGLCHYFAFLTITILSPSFHWTHLENLRKSPHLNILNLITSAKYLLTCKVTSSQFPRMRTWDKDYDIFRRP